MGWDYDFWSIEISSGAEGQVASELEGAIILLGKFASAVR